MNSNSVGWYVILVECSNHVTLLCCKHHEKNDLYNVKFTVYVAKTSNEEEKK